MNLLRTAASLLLLKSLEYTSSHGTPLDVSGSILVEKFINPRGYHEKGRGLLTGSVSGDDYTLDFENNLAFNGNTNVWTWGYTFPMVLKHEGKLVAVIHYSYRGVTLLDDWIQIVDRNFEKIECK